MRASHFIFAALLIAAFVAVSFVFPFLRYEFGHAREWIGGAMILAILAYVTRERWMGRFVG